ncbi:hypothetical protein HAP32_05181 (plasmid) [Serratia fonticola]|nr:hypothetical protein HAP32_05145 [Serratia fonticola]QIP94553.1 hypothetical protein HAP32_05181 [Serratia fonticola]RDL12929.1 hypothetical protein DFO62_1422 [Serratia fonticola]
MGKEPRRQPAHVAGVLIYAGISAGRDREGLGTISCRRR